MKRILPLAMIAIMMVSSLAIAENINFFNEKNDFWKDWHPNQKLAVVGYIQYNMDEFKDGKIRVSTFDDPVIKDVLIERVDKDKMDELLKSGPPVKIPDLGEDLLYLPYRVSVLAVVDGHVGPVFRYVGMRKSKK
jgi:hypothetical protein